MGQDELTTPLAKLMAEGRREDAYVWFREHQDRFSRREQRLIRAVLSKRLWRAPVLLAAATLALQVTAASSRTSSKICFPSWAGPSGPICMWPP